MKIENTKSQMRKGILEYCILRILSKGEAYPSDIVNTLKTAGLDVVEGTVYPLLTRMKNAEVLSYRWEESSSGPPRKYYVLSERGEEILNQLKISWTELSNAVQAITK